MEAEEYRLTHTRIHAYGKSQNAHTLVREWQERNNFSDVAHTAKKLSRESIAVPQVYTFNARVSTTLDFPVRYFLDGVEIRTGLLADAVVLRKGESAGIVTGDCPTLVIENIKTGDTVASHAGRDSNIDRQKIDTGIPSREHDGVVSSILSFTQWNPEDLRIFICAGIAPEHFDHPWAHPTYGESNKKMTEWISENYGRECVLGDVENGCIDMPALIRAQCIHSGISAEHIQHDGIDTYSDERFWSHRNKNKGGGRNIVIVTNS